MDEIAIESLKNPQGKVTRELLIKLANGTDEEKRAVMQYCYSLIDRLLRRYLDMREEYYNIATLWIIGTYIHKSFETYPIIFLNAMKSSGKTRLLKLMASLSQEGMMMGLPSEAVIFRTAEKSTFCIDEFESVGNKEKGFVRELLNASYKKGQFITRTRKIMSKGVEDYKPIDYPVYAPIAIANINGMDDVLNDRCITLTLERSENQAKTRLSERVGYKKEFRNTLETIKLCLSEIEIGKMYDGWDEECIKKDENMTTVTSVTSPGDIGSSIESTKNENPLVPPTSSHMSHMSLNIYNNKYNNIYNNLYNSLFNSTLDGRPMELFLPLLFIAYKTKEDIFSNLLRMAEEMVAEVKENNLYESNDIMLFDYLSKLPYSELDWIGVGTICSGFKQSMGYDDKFVNPQWVGSALKRLKMTLEKDKKNDGHYVRLKMTFIRDKMKRYKDDGKAPITHKEAHSDEKSKLMDFFHVRCKENPTNDVMHEEWYEAFKDKYSETEFDKIVSKIQAEGLIYSPRKNYYKEA